MKGYDVFFTDPDSVDEMKCRVCGTFCDVKRGENGSTGWAQAMANGKTLHDYFYCPYKEEKWHEQAFRLVQDIEKCYSPSLKKIMEEDLKKMIEDKGK
jgi:hypothetical protein